MGEAGPVSPQYVVEHLNHLSIVGEVCRKIGMAAWVAYRVFVAQGYEAIAAHAATISTAAARRHYLEIERQRGVPGVLAAAGSSLG
jgi:hypothetical protein